MNLISKCFAVALSALFAATPMTPAAAMPFSGAGGQIAAETPANGNGLQLVRDNHESEILRRKRARNAHRHRDVRRSDRHYRQNRHYSRGDRRGWYRGHRGYRHARPGYRHYNGYWFPLAAFGMGAVVGGAIANDRGYVGGSSHVNWCANRYRSYRAYDNTFQPYNGPRRQCISPYS